MAPSAVTTATAATVGAVPESCAVYSLIVNDCGGAQRGARRAIGVSEAAGAIPLGEMATIVSTIGAKLRILSLKRCVVSKCMLKSPPRRVSILIHVRTTEAPVRSGCA